MRKILILASNPNRDLALDREIRDLEGVVKRSKNRDEFEVRVGSAVRPEDLQELLLDCEPQIVHFCGHGTGEQGLVLQNSAGREQLVSTSALSSLFKLFTGKVECVLLNACYSEVQANAISQHINYVIGMSQTILDDAAIAFATGFYRGLGYGRTTDEAYHFGCNAIELMPSTTVISRSPTAPQERKLTAEFTVIPGAPIAVPEHLKPVLKTRQTLAAQSNSVNIPAVPTSETKRVEIAQDVSNALEREAWLKQYRNCVRDFLADGVLTPEEKLRLGLLAKQLGLDPAEAIAIFQEEERLRFASVPPGQVAVAADSPIQPLFASETVAPARSQLKQRSLLLGGAVGLLGLGIAVFSSHLFVKKELPSASTASSASKAGSVPIQISAGDLVPPPLSTTSSASDSVSPPSTVNPPLEAKPSGTNFLATARQQADSDNLTAAIATLAQITPDQSSYGDAKDLAQQWYGKLLGQLKDTYGECEADRAIAKLQNVPAQSTVYQQAQTDVLQWQQKWTAWTKIARDLEQNYFDSATAEAEQIAATYCKQTAQASINERKEAWSQEQRAYLDKVKEFLTASNLADAKATADKIEITELKEEANRLIAIAPHPPSSNDGTTTVLPQRICYRVSVSTASVHANYNLTDNKVDETLTKISNGTRVSTANPPDSENASSADNPDKINWVKVTVPNVANPEGWVAERQLDLLGAAECQP